MLMSDPWKVPRGGAGCPRSQASDQKVETFSPSHPDLRGGEGRGIEFSHPEPIIWWVLIL